jgi:hypothetical protein
MLGFAGFSELVNSILSESGAMFIKYNLFKNRRDESYHL